MTDRGAERAANWASLATRWDRRADVAAAWLTGAKRVADIGCGLMSLRDHFEPGTDYVQKQSNGGFKGQLRTLAIRADIEIVPNRGKMGDQPDYRVLSNGFELGGGWIRTGEVSGREYIRVSVSAPELGARPLYANLGRAAGQDDEDAFALIWNPGD